MTARDTRHIRGQSQESPQAICSRGTTEHSTVTLHQVNTCASKNKTVEQTGCLGRKCLPGTCVMRVSYPEQGHTMQTGRGPEQASLKEES